MQDYIVELKEKTGDSVQKFMDSEMRNILHKHRFELHSADKGLGKIFQLASSNDGDVDDENAVEVIKALQAPALQSVVAAAYVRPRNETPGV